MPRNGLGVYTLPATTWNPAVTNTTIESSAWNSTASDLASALTQSLSKDGQTVPTGNIQMGNFKIISMADGGVSTDAATYGQTLHTTGAQTLSGNLIVNGSVSLSGNLTVTGAVIFTNSTLSIGNLTVTSVASVASLQVTGTTNLNLLNVASVSSLNTLNVASVASIGTLRVSSTIVVGTASGSVATGYINAKGYLVDGAATSGKLVQRVYFQTGAYASGSTVIPYDDSIPQNTEGDQYMTASITPTNASNIINVQVFAQIDATASGAEIVGALFRDTTANAVAAVANGTTTGQNQRPLMLNYSVVAGSTSATKFKLRAGPTNGTMVFNGFFSTLARVFGGVSNSGIVITEYTP